MDMERTPISQQHLALDIPLADGVGGGTDTSAASTTVSMTSDVNLYANFNLQAQVQLFI